MSAKNVGKGLILDNLKVTHGDETVLEIDESVAPGEVLTIMGASGSGKSTLVNAVAGFLQRDFRCSGKVFLDGVNISSMPPEQRHVGILFQDSLLFPHLSVIENVMFAIPASVKGNARQREAEELMAAVGLGDFGDRDPHTLSGGQQARVALIRVLAAQPCVLLLDEPFSKLDAGLRDSVRQLVFDEVSSRQLPALLVTHDQADAEAASGRIVSL